MKRQGCTWAWSLMMVLVAGIGGCATEPDPLDKTQTESIHKSVFEGEWYFKVTVTDTEWHNEYTFIGEETANYAGGSSKIRWEITQDYLNGYLMPEKYMDAEGNLVENLIGKESMVFSFRIERHFDIRYLQNNTTREELNVIVENTDRPWNEREYVIVDWSKNYATDLWQPLALDLEAGNLVRQPVDTWENVEFFNTNDERVNTKAWRPNKDPDIYVINIDLQEQIHSTMEYWWQIYYGEVMEPTLVKYRISMKKKEPYGVTKAPYRAMQYRDEFFWRFGFFRTEFETYDPDRGPLESQKQYLVNRFNLKCYDDPDTLEEVCPKLVYVMSPSMPTKEEDPDLYQWTADTMKVWNDVLQEATGRTDTVVELWENEPLVDADGSPIYAADGTMRHKYELGDIRYNFVNYVTKPLSYAPLGYGPSVPDPDTGEIINATLNIYGNWLDYVVTRALDLYDVVAGNCTLEDIGQGRFWNEETEACDGGNPGITSYKAKGKRADLNFLTPAMKTAYWPKMRVNQPTVDFDHERARQIKPYVKQQHLEQLKNGRPLDLGKLSIAAGTPYERQMIPSASFGSTFPGADKPDQVLDNWSAANRLSETNLWKVRRHFEKLGRFCQLEPDHYENNILAFVEEWKDRPRDEVKRELRKWVYFTSAVHEMGHNLGLRHNFRGSVDKPNFPDEFHVEYSAYWTQVEALQDRYWDRIQAGDAGAYEEYVTQVHQIPTKHERYAISSIMDYHGDWEGWLNVAPSYDRAALLFAYGGKIEIRGDSGWQVSDYQSGDFVKDDVYDYGAPSASGRIVRYYMNCSDERTWDDLFCQRHDRGVTATEIVSNMIRDSYKAYFFTNFKRDSTMFDSRRAGYYWRKWFHYYDYAKAFAHITVSSIWYDEFWDTLWDGLDAINAGPPSRDMVPGYTRTGGEDLMRASLLYYYYLMYDVLQRPNYGLYELKYDAYGKRYWESTEPAYVGEGAKTATIDPGPGWGWNDRWNSQYEHDIYYDKLIQIGVELDKVIAYEVLSIPAALNEYLWHEKANGNSYWSDIFNANGHQLWKVTRSFITDVFTHDQNPWCMSEDSSLIAYPVDLLEGAARADLITKPYFDGETRCATGFYPVQPGMDALYAIYPIFYGTSGSQHPWYHNQLSDYLDSQVKGGNHRFDIPDAAWTEGRVAEFTNSTGTKTYQAVQTEDGLSVSYQLVDKGRRIANRMRFMQTCDEGGTPNLNPADPENLILGTFGRTCDEVLACDAASPPDYCDPEGWDGLYLYPVLGNSDLDRVEAMLIMMQDMIDLAGHYAWYTPGYLEDPS